MISQPDTENPGTAQGCPFIPALHLALPGLFCQASLPGFPEAAWPLCLGARYQYITGCPVPYGVSGET